MALKKTFLNVVTSLVLLLATQVTLAQTNNNFLNQLRKDISDLQQANLAVNQMKQDIKDLKKTDSVLCNEVKKLKTDFSHKMNAIQDSITKLKSELQTNKQDINNIHQHEGIKITTTENNEEKKQMLGKIFEKNTLYWIIEVLIIVLLSVLLFGLLRKQFTKK